MITVYSLLNLVFLFHLCISNSSLFLRLGYLSVVLSDSVSGLQTELLTTSQFYHNYHCQCFICGVYCHKQLKFCRNLLRPTDVVLLIIL